MRKLSFTEGKINKQGRCVFNMKLHKGTNTEESDIKERIILKDILKK
jgi:hypothetical protein